MSWCSLSRSCSAIHDRTVSAAKEDCDQTYPCSFYFANDDGTSSELDFSSLCKGPNDDMYTFFNTNEEHSYVFNICAPIANPKFLIGRAGAIGYAPERDFA